MKYKIAFTTLSIAIAMGLLATAAVKLATPATAEAAPKTTTVIYYGDSITFESSTAIAAQFKNHPNWKYSIVALPSRALCDLQPRLVSDLAAKHPQIVVLETMGNSNDSTTCMKNSAGQVKAMGSQPWIDQYRADLGTFFKTASAAKVKVLFVNPIPEYIIPNNNALNQLTKVANHEALMYHGISITSAPRNAVSNNGTYVKCKTRMSAETASMECKAKNAIVVRAPDGIHLCPTGFPIPPATTCSVYSSGEVRFGTAIVNATFNLPKPLLP